MSDLNKVLEEIQSLERAERQLTAVNQKLSKEYDRLEQLQKNMDREYADVEKLEKLSLKGLFHKVLGDKEKQLEAERQEYLQAFLKYKEFKKSIEILEFEQKILKEKLQKKGDLQKRKTEILNQAEEKIKKSGTNEGRQLIRIDRQIMDEMYIKREINEALIVGAKASDVIKKMLSHLQTASNWGTWDVVGRNTAASYMKHSSIDRAKDLAYQGKRILEQYEEELRDVYGNNRVRLNLQLDSFHRFTDIFFDNLITDWIILQKIQNAISSVKSTFDKIRRIQDSLKLEMEKSDKKINYLENQKREIVMQLGK